MGTLVLAVDPGPSSHDPKMRHAFARSKRWEALLKRKPLYPLFLKACWKAEARGIPTLEEFNRQWPPEKDRLVYVAPGFPRRPPTDPPSSEECP